MKKNKLTDIENILVSLIDKANISNRCRNIFLSYLTTDSTFVDIANKINLSPERVAQLYHKTNRKLRHRVTSIDKVKAVKNDLRKEVERKEYYKNKLENITDEGIIDIESNGIEQLDINVRVYNSLKCNNINYIYDLKDYPVKEILEFRNLGKKSLQNLINGLKKVGLIDYLRY